MSTFSNLLISRFKTLIRNIQPKLTSTQKTEMDTSTFEMVSDFETFVYKYLSDPTSKIFFREMQNKVSGIINLAFSGNHLDLVRSTYPDIFVEINQRLLHLVRVFYLQQVLPQLEQLYQGRDLHVSELSMYSVTIKKVILNIFKKIPVICSKFSGLNEVLLFNALTSIAYQVNMDINKIYCEQMFSDVVSKTKEELFNINEAVMLNAIWIIDKIETNLYCNIEGFNFPLLQAQITATSALKNINLKESDCHISSSVDVDVDVDVDVEVDVRDLDDKNDLFLLGCITRSARLEAIPLDKQRVLNAINSDLMLISILYICLIIAQDTSVCLEDFVQYFACNHLTVDQCSSGLNTSFANKNENEQSIQKAKIITSAINYMVQFIFRSAGHKLVYEVDSQFVARCHQDVAKLADDLPELTEADSAPSSRSTSPVYSSVILPLYSGILGLQLDLTTRTDSIEKSHEQKKLRINNNFEI